MHKSGRRLLAHKWFGEIEDLSIPISDLANPGSVFEQYDGKCLIATIEAVEGQLIGRVIAREIRKARKEGKIFAGRQALRLVLEGF